MRTVTPPGPFAELAGVEVAEWTSFGWEPNTWRKEPIPATIGASAASVIGFAETLRPTAATAIG